MKVPARTQAFLQEYNIELEAVDTGRAVQRFNELTQTEANVVAALHLTC